jgi:hypothetical protein
MLRTINDATYDDLTYIGSWLCDEDRLELALTRNTDDYVALANDAWASKYKYVALEEAVPVMAFGARPMQGTALVWGFKTERGWGAIRSVTKFIRRTMIPARTMPSRSVGYATLVFPRGPQLRILAPGSSSSSG